MASAFADPGRPDLLTREKWKRQQPRAVAATSRRKLAVMAVTFFLLMFFMYQLRTPTGPNLKEQANIQDGPVSTQPPLHVPVWWFAPFLDASSFGVEATQLMSALIDTGLLRPQGAWISLLQMSCEDTMAGVLDKEVHARLLGMLQRGAKQHNLAMKAQQSLHMSDYSDGSDAGSWHHAKKASTLRRGKEVSRKQQPGGAQHDQAAVQGAIVVCHNMPKFYGRPRAPWASCSPCPPPNYPAAYTVARAMAETDRFPAEFVSSVNSLDEVWVPSAFSKDVLVGSGVQQSKVHIVPLTVNTTFLSPSLHPKPPHPFWPPDMLPSSIQVFGPPEPPGPGARLTVFLSVFKWEKRKGWDALLAAYLSEFTSQDSVMLVILTRPFLTQGSIQEHVANYTREQLGFQQTKELPRLFVITDSLAQVQYASMLASVDIFVLPTRGEGWGLPMVEAMSMGKPVIATHVSGVTAYLDDQVGYPLRYQLVPVPDSEPAWFRGSRWAEPDVQHLRQLMRSAAQNPSEAEAKGTAARARMVERYSPDVVGHLLYNQFTRITSLLESRSAVKPKTHPRHG